MSDITKGGEFLLPSDKLPNIFTIQDLTEDQKFIRRTVREFIEKEVVPDEVVYRMEIKKDWVLVKDILKGLGNLGILGAEIPEEHGGQGLDKITGAIIAEEVSAQGSFATTLLAHTGIGILPIRFFGTEEQKRKYLSKLISGEWIASYCLTEIGAGSDVESIKTTATLSEDREVYILNGEKVFVTNGGFASVYILFAKLNNIPTAFIVERNISGLTVGNEEHKMGIQGSSTTTVVLNNAEVPLGNLLGEPGNGKKIALNILNLGRFKLGAACLGAGRICLKESLKRSKDRKQFKKQISEFGVIRQKLALMAAKVFAMESVIYRTAGHLEETIGQVDSNDSKAVLKAVEEFAIECSLVKVFCSEGLDYIVDENVQIHGGMGFCEGNPERHYRDSRINRIFEGTNEINTLLIPGMILSRSFKGQLPLISEAKKLQNELLSSSLQDKPEDLIAELFIILKNSKKAVLLASAISVEKWMPEAKGDLKKIAEIMELHQISLYLMGKCMINIFVLESALAALAKNRNEVDECKVQLIFNDMIPELEKWAREILVMSSEGDSQRTYLSALKRFTKFTPYNTEQICNKIAGHILQGA